MILQTYSNASTPPVVTLRDASGEFMRVLGDRNPQVLEVFAIPNPEFFQFETSDGIELNASFIKPLDFDPEKK